MSVRLCPGVVPSLHSMKMPSLQLGVLQRARRSILGDPFTVHGTRVPVHGTRVSAIARGVHVARFSACAATVAPCRRET